MHCGNRIAVVLAISCPAAQPCTSPQSCATSHFRARFKAAYSTTRRSVVPSSTKLTRRRADSRLRLLAAVQSADAPPAAVLDATLSFEQPPQPHVPSLGDTIEEVREA
jgi:hypothetical protein